MPNRGPGDDHAYMVPALGYSQLPLRGKNISPRV